MLLLYASNAVAPIATPHGFACLTITQSASVEGFNAFPLHRHQRCCCRQFFPLAIACSSPKHRRLVPNRDRKKPIDVVFTVTHFLYFSEMHIQGLWISTACGVCFIFAQAGQIIGDGAIVLCCVCEHFFANINLVSYDTTLLLAFISAKTVSNR